MSRFPNSERADQAAAWVSRMDCGAWTQDQEAELRQWLDGDPLRAGALLQAQAAWAALDGLAAGVPEQAALPKRAHNAVSRRALMAGGGALAASLVGGWLWRASQTRYSTALGEIRRIPLNDGSIAAINTESEVEIRLAKSRREIRLLKGEAWFHVAKDPRRPFVVEAGPVTVQAVGTAFSVRRLGDGAEILVTEGTVETWAPQGDGLKTRLQAGEKLLYARDARARREMTAPSSIDRALAWRGGKVDLSGDTLEAAITEFNRYNKRRIALTDASLRGDQIDGVFRTDDPVGFSLAVQRSLGIHVDLSDPDVITMGKTP